MLTVKSGGMISLMHRQVSYYTNNLEVITIIYNHPFESNKNIPNSRQNFKTMKPYN